MSHRQTTLALILGVAGLTIATWGLVMALFPYPRLEPMFVAAILAGGLALIGLALLWLGILLAMDKSSSHASGEPIGPTLAAGTNLPNQERLFRAITSLQDGALDLIERRREIHHLNTQQWHYVHDRETQAEIEATKTYRSVRSALEKELEKTPAPFWGPVEWFARTVETSVDNESYSYPGDLGVHQSMDQHGQEIVRLIGEIASGTNNN